MEVTVIGDLPTKKQLKVFNFICRMIKKKGRPPTIRDVMDYMKFTSPNGAMCHLRALQKKGFIGGVGKPSGGVRTTGTLHVTAGRKCRCCDGLGRIIDGTEED